MIVSLFRRRIRGIRLINLGGMMVLFAVVIGLYLVKTMSSGEHGQITATQAQIAEERRRIRLLHAEVAYLEQPTRIGRLSEQYLNLQPIAAKHEIVAPESLAAVAAPEHPPASTAPAAAAAPDATATTPAAPAVLAAPAPDGAPQ